MSDLDPKEKLRKLRFGLIINIEYAQLSLNLISAVPKLKHVRSSDNII